MEFTSDFFQKMVFTPEQIEKYLENARKDLKIAEKSGMPEVIFHFCYNAAIKLGITLIAGKGYKVRSIPGHHVKILEILGKTTGMEDEANYFDRVRRKRNIDLYEGGSGFTRKEADDLLKVTQSLFEKTYRNSRNSPKSPNSPNGFTLVELIVSVAIASIMMLGMSVFFSGTLHNVFQTQDRLAKTQGQFVVNEIIRDKFANLETLQAYNTDYVVIKNRITKNQLPFSYIGKNGDKLVFKDFFVFNDVETDGGDIYYGDSGAGAIQEDGNNIVTPPANFAGFARDASGNFYVALPAENKVVKCNGEGCDTTSLVAGLNNPMDVETDDANLYISDSGNNRVISVPINNGDTTVLAENLNFPTGLAIDGDYLFVADTLNNRVIRVDKSDGNNLIVIAGEGDNADCDSSALYCKLNLPTGLFADGTNKALYIADTGSDRILKMWDPGTIVKTAVPVKLDYKNDILLNHLKITFFGENNFVTAPVIASTDLHKGAYSVNGQTLTYNLFTSLASNIIIQCTGDPPCTLQNFASMQVNDDLFNNNDTVKFTTKPDDTYTITSGAGTPDYTYSIIGDTTAHSAEENVYLANSIVQKTINTTDIITIDLSSIYSSPLPNFSSAKIEFYKQDNPVIPDFVNYVINRNGDSIIGGVEDEILPLLTSLHFPTGLSLISSGSPPITQNLIFADSFADTENEIKNYAFSGNPTPIQNIDPFSFNFTNFDYTSDFTLNTGGLTFTKTPDNKILQAVITAVVDSETTPPTTQTYTLNAAL
ncbi:prepilin-type N-terminal cleavage/methylation domain-containing protein [Candidatus Peregrinibacteria bacterium]|nr:prepilin-type N-terminal cleavage/methylation domain-containing protein [Candidatus Peregrinibacteria bacterium]